MSAVQRTAERERNRPWPQPLISHFSRFWKDGNRTAYENLVRERQNRLSRAVIMAATTDAEGWLNEAADGIALVCEQTGWSWAAHDDTFSRYGAVVPDARTPYLDLGAGELAAQLAWADSVIGPRLDQHFPGLRRIIRDRVCHSVFEPFLTRRDWPWLGLTGDVHNWNPWIHGNVITAALLLMENVPVRASLISRAIDGLDRYVAQIPPDGAVDEGFGYWWNGACRSLEALDVLRHASAGVLDARKVPALSATVGFPHRMHIGGSYYLNVADGPARTDGTEPWQVVHAWARHVGDRDAERHAASQRDLTMPAAHVEGGLGRFLRAISDDHWIHATASPPHIEDSWFPSVQILVAREHPGSERGLVLTVKGGHNGEHHNHLDVGSVTVSVDGVPLLVDAGKVTYDSRTFGADRYRIRAMQSGWHSVPAPGGAEQGIGSDFHANVNDVSATSLALDLSPAYPQDRATYWNRTAALERDNRTVTVTDTWDIRGDDPRAVINYLCRGEISVRDEQTIRIDVPALSVAAEMTWDRDDVSVSVHTWWLEDPELSAIWGEKLTRISLRIPVRAGQCSVFLRRA